MNMMIKEGNFVRFPDFTEATLSGTSDELEALAHALIMKARYPDTFFHTHTGIEGILLEVVHVKK